MLALEDWGLATNWVKEYGGLPGTGFGLVPPEAGFDTVLGAVEFRPEPR